MSDIINEITLTAFPHLECLHLAEDKQPSPAASLTWSTAAADSAGSFPRPAQVPWSQQKDHLVDHVHSRFLDGVAYVAELDLNPTPQSVVSEYPVL